MSTQKSNLGLQHGNGSRFKLAAVGYDTTKGENGAAWEGVALRCSTELGRCCSVWDICLSSCYCFPG